MDLTALEMMDVKDSAPCLVHGKNSINYIYFYQRKGRGIINFTCPGKRTLLLNADCLKGFGIQSAIPGTEM